MRVTPIAIWGARDPDPALTAAAAMADASLSHPDAVCQHANAAYCHAIRHLTHPGDAEGAVRATVSWLTSHASPEPAAAATAATAAGGSGAATAATTAADGSGAAAAIESASGARTVLEWVTDAVGTGPDVAMRGNKVMGWVRWGVFHAFRALASREPRDLRATLEHVMAKGGDTDTNTCMVGGMVGALVGAAAIPEALKGPVLARTEHSPEGRRRLAFLQSSLVPGLVEQLLRAGGGAV